MKRIALRWVAVCAAAALAPAIPSARGDVAAREVDYSLIVKRNPFDLKPPPPPAPPPPPPAPKVDIKLTGISSIVNPKRAYLMITPEGQKEPEYLDFTADDPEKEGFKVLAIDDAAQSVRIRHRGVETLLTFATHGVAAAPIQTAPTPAPGAPSAVARTAARGAGLPGQPRVGAISPSAPASGGVIPIPSRNVRTPPQTQYQYGMGGSALPGANRQFNLEGQPAPTGARQRDQLVPQVPEVPVSTEEAIILMEAQRHLEPHIEFPPPLPIVPGGP